MTEKRNELRDAAIAMIFVIALLVASITGLMNFFHEPKDPHVTLEVVGVINETNTTTVVQLHFECIELCTQHYSESIQKLTACWEQCAKLGK